MRDSRCFGRKNLIGLDRYSQPEPRILSLHLGPMNKDTDTNVLHKISVFIADC
jgi:hypothetical protein